LLRTRRASPRALVAAVILALVAAGCSDTPAKPGRPTSPKPNPSTATSSTAPTSHDRCQGVSFDEVRGARPAYVRGPLKDYPAAGAVCAAYWLPDAQQLFVPQSLEIDGTTAYVAGYRWHRGFSRRPCQIAVVDTATGRTTAFVKRWQAPVYGPEPTFCRHAGGMEMIPEGLLVQETQRLWLLDPARFGNGDPVLRVWRLPTPLRGSTLVVSGGRLGIGEYRPTRPGTLWWFRLADVMAPGIAELGAPVRRRPVPAALQGMGEGPGGVWFSSSNTRCGVLRGPGAATVAFVPGAEDVEFRGPDLWAVSEASAKPFLNPNERPVPPLQRLDASQVRAGEPSGCAGND
jgi:hypothetical protein